LPRTRENKQEVVAALKADLQGVQLALVINYEGVTVAEITNLRQQLRPKGAICKITKNTLMRIAVQGDDAWEPITEFLKGNNAFVLIKEDLGGAIKAYQEFQKALKKTELLGGVMEGRALNEADIKAITELPSKEELMAQIARGINATPTKLAVGINAVPTKLAVGINEVPSKLVRAIKAIAEKDQDSGQKVA